MTSLVETVHLSSSNASSKDHHGSFTCRLGTTLHHVRSIELAAASVPNTFESIRDGETLILNTGGSDITVALTAGAFTSATIKTMLKTQLEAVDSGRTYTVDFSNTTFKLSIARDSGTFTLRSSSDRVARVLGLSQTAGSAASSLVAAEAAQLGLNAIVIGSKALRNPLMGERAGTFVVHQQTGSGGITNYKSSDYRQIVTFPSPIRVLSAIDIQLLSVFPTDGVMDPGHPVDLTLRISHEPR